jgi:hypothetical protein
MKAGCWVGLGVALALACAGCGGDEAPAAAPPPAADEQAAKGSSDNGAARRAATMLQDAMLSAGTALDEATGTRASLARTGLKLKAAVSGTSDAIALMSAESYPRSAQLLTAARHQREYLEAMESAATARSRTDIRQALRSAQSAGRSASSGYVELGRVAPELVGRLPEASSFEVAALRSATDEAVARTREKPPAPPVTNAPAPAAGSRSFHAGTGNVSCVIDADSAACAVATLGETFVLPASGAAFLEPGLRLGRGAGERVAYGTSVSVGSVVCDIPPENVARGITCTKGAHGFEASRVPSRQKLF